MRTETEIKTELTRLRAAQLSENIGARIEALEWALSGDGIELEMYPPEAIKQNYARFYEERKQKTGS